MCHIDFDNNPIQSTRPSYNYIPKDKTIQPAVTIITPFFNTTKIFHETARSVLHQSFQQWEWLIINDGSTDPEALDVLNYYRNFDPRIRVIDHPINRGLSAARNTGIEHARTDFIVNIDSDDLLEPTAVEKWFWFLVSYPQFAFVQGYVVGFGAQKYLWQGGFHECEKFLVENRATANAMFRRSVAIRVGKFDESIRQGMEDWDFWLRCASRGFWGSTIPEYLCWYRRREEQGKRWTNLSGEGKVQQFLENLAVKYPNLWSDGFPKVKRDEPSPYEEVSDVLPATNILDKSKSRLLMILPWFEIGGADKFNLDLLRGLVQRYDYEVTIITTLPSSNPWYYEFAKYTPDIFVLENFLHLRDYPRFIRYIIQSRQIETVLISNSEFAYLVLPYLRSHFPGVVFIDYLHMEEENWKNGGHPRFSLTNQSQLTLTVVSSQYLKSWMLKNGACEKKIRVCTTNIDPDYWNPSKYNRSAIRKAIGIGTDENKQVILYSGRLVDQKQPMLAAEVFLELKRSHMSFIALVVGDGPYFSIMSSFFKEHQMAEVKMLGAVSNDRMRELLAISDIFFLPSLQEGISLAIYEAMAMGVTPVGADVGGQRELVTPDCGILVRRGSSEFSDYVRALKLLLSNPEKCKKMGRSARERICKYYRLDQMTECMIKLFDEAHQRKKMSVSYPIDVTFAREIATRAVEMMRIELAWPKTQVKQADANPDKSVKFLSLYPTKTLAKAMLWKILRKSANILRMPQSLRDRFKSILLERDAQ